MNTKKIMRRIFRIRIKVCKIRKIRKEYAKKYADNMQNMQSMEKNTHKIRK
jgi:hypothetical protein